MVIWRGLGWLAVVIVILTFVGTQYGVDNFIATKGFYTANDWPKYLATGLSALFVGILGLSLNSGNGNHHTLFFIPVQYWSVIILIGGVALALS